MIDPDMKIQGFNAPKPLPEQHDFEGKRSMAAGLLPAGMGRKPTGPKIADPRPQCVVCKGTGKIEEVVCEECAGSGRIKGDETPQTIPNRRFRRANISLNAPRNIRVLIHNNKEGCIKAHPHAVSRWLTPEEMEAYNNLTPEEQEKVKRQLKNNLRRAKKAGLR